MAHHVLTGLLLGCWPPRHHFCRSNKPLILDYVLDLQHYADNTSLDSGTEGPHLHIGEAIAIPSDVVENNSITRCGRKQINNSVIQRTISLTHRWRRVCNLSCARGTHDRTIHLIQKLKHTINGIFMLANASCHSIGHVIGHRSKTFPAWIPVLITMSW